MDEAAWQKLMNRVREKNVIPIIGPRLLVGADGQTSLQAQMAAHLMQSKMAASLMQACGKNVGEISLPPFRELNEAVSQLKGIGADPQDLYDSVHEAIRAVTSAEHFTTPEPIQQLAEIADFRLFVTLTPDDLLASCLRERCAVNEIIYSP